MKYETFWNFGSILMMIMMIRLWWSLGWRIFMQIFMMTNEKMEPKQRFPLLIKYHNEYYGYSISVACCKKYQRQYLWS